MVCLLHFNELPFRSLFEFIDGATSGPNTYTGPIGSKLKGCKNLSVVTYKPIKCDLPDANSADLSKDQRYLLDISRAVVSSTRPSDLSCRNPGHTNHAHWLACANGILRLCISTPRPSVKLRDLLTYTL